MTAFQELSFFFSYSPKRKEILKQNFSTSSDVEDLLADCPKEEHEERLFKSALNRESLPTLSDTHWLSRVDSISTLIANYSKIYDAVAQVKAQSKGVLGWNGEIPIYYFSCFDPVCLGIYKTPLCSPPESSHRSQKSGLPFSWFKNRREVRETVCKSCEDCTDHRSFTIKAENYSTADASSKRTRWIYSRFLQVRI